VILFEEAKFQTAKEDVTKCRAGPTHQCTALRLASLLLWWSYKQQTQITRNKSNPF